MAGNSTLVAAGEEKKVTQQDGLLLVMQMKPLYQDQASTDNKCKTIGQGTAIPRTASEAGRVSDTEPLGCRLG